MTKFQLRIRLARLTGLSFFLTKTQSDHISDLYREQGLQRGDEGEYLVAINNITQAIKFKPLDKALFIKRGEYFQQLEDHASAIEDFFKSN